MTTRAIAFSAGQTRDRGMDAIGADHEFSRDLALPIVSIFDAHAADTTVEGFENDDLGTAWTAEHSHGGKLPAGGETLPGRLGRHGASLDGHGVRVYDQGL